MTGIALVGGALAGSAAGAALGRWPDGGSLLRPARSRCASCASVLRPRDLVPILSWLALRGRCAMCGAPIDPRLILLEGGSAVLVALVVHRHGPTLLGVLLAVGTVAVLLATLTDLSCRRIPDRLTVPLAVIALAGTATMVQGASGVGRGLAWALGVPVLLHAVNVLAAVAGRPRAVGGGDIKLLVGVLALAATIDGGAPTVMLLAVTVAGLVATMGLASGLLERGDRLPFAPAIAVGYLVTVLLPDVARAVTLWPGAAS